MTKKLFVFTAIFALLFNLQVWAANAPGVEAMLNGTVKTGNTIEIYIDVNNINRFYAGFLEYNYDNSIIEVLEVIPGDLIKKESISKMEFGGDAKKSPGKINYYFTCTGQVDGFSGSGRFVTIKAKVIKDGSLKINSIPFSQSTDGSNNLKLQLCERTPSNEIKELSYSFKGLSTSSTSNGNDNGSGNGAGAVTGNGTGVGDKLSGKETAGSSNALSESASKDKDVTNSNTSKENQGSNLAEDKNKTEHKDASNTLDKGETQEDKDSKDANATASKNEKKSNLVVITVLLCLIIIGVGAYIFYKRNHKKTP